MNNTFKQITKISRPLFVLALLVFVFSSFSQRITGNYKTNKMEIEQAVTLTLPENQEIISANNQVPENNQDALVLAKEENADKFEAESVAPVLTKKSTKKTFKEKIAKTRNGKVENLKISSLSSLPLLAMNKSGNVKSVKKPMRDYLVLGIVLLVVGLVVGIFGGIFGVIGSILAIIGLIFIILYIVQVAT